MVTRLLRYLRSFVRPVVYRADGEVVAIIRGTTFRGRSLAEVCRQVVDEKERLRRRLSADASHASAMMVGTGPHGKGNPGAAMLGGTIAATAACEAFLERYCRAPDNCQPP